MNRLDSIDNFYNQYSQYPNIFEANSYTYSQIDFLTNVDSNERSKVKKINELSNISEPPLGDDLIKLSSFQSNNCSLDFAINEKLDDKEFMLIYDSEPDWDNETNILNSPVEVDQWVLIEK